MIETIGWIGAALFALCGAPQAYLSYKQGHSDGVSHGLLWMWFWGEVLTMIYVFVKHGLDLPLMMNYTINIIFVMVIIKYKYWRRIET